MPRAQARRPQLENATKNTFGMFYLLSAEDRKKLREQKTTGKNGCDLTGDIRAESERKKMVLLVRLDADLLDNA